MGGGAFDACSPPPAALRRPPPSRGRWDVGAPVGLGLRLLLEQRHDLQGPTSDDLRGVPDDGADVVPLPPHEERRRPGKPLQQGRCYQRRLEKAALQKFLGLFNQEPSLNAPIHLLGAIGDKEPRYVPLSERHETRRPDQTWPGVRPREFRIAIKGPGAPNKIPLRWKWDEVCSIRFADDHGQSPETGLNLPVIGP
jgi:hypothetical protein